MSPGHRLLQGTALGILADVLFPLTGIVTAAFLTRNLGAGYYGLLTLSATLISWLELAIGALFTRATVKIVGEAKDWRPIGAVVLRLHVFVGFGAMAACWILAKPCALLLGEPRLAEYLTLFAIDLPIFAVANCHRSILIGKGKYAERAISSAGRWIARLALILLLVELGLSLSGAILGMIGASVVELAIARYYIRPSWSWKKGIHVPLWSYAVPIFLATLVAALPEYGFVLFERLGSFRCAGRESTGHLKMWLSSCRAYLRLLFRRYCCRPSFECCVKATWRLPGLWAAMRYDLYWRCVR